MNAISASMLLGSLTVGLAVIGIGYLGYRVVTWLINKPEPVKQVEKVAQQALSSKAATTTRKKANPIEEHLMIVQHPRSVKDYLDEEYKGKTPAAIKYRTRLQNIQTHFNKDQVYPVRGDGNCFCNAAVAGLLSIPNNRQNITTILEKFRHGKDYIKSDLTSGEPHLTKFNKDDDFETVINLIRSDLTTKDLLDDFEFTAAFSRIIRHTLSTTSPDLSSSASGDEIDMNAICVLNQVFNTQAKMVVLAAPLQEADPNSPEFAYVAGGKTLYEDVSIVNLREKGKSKPEFLIIRKSAHFITLT